MKCHDRILQLAASIGAELDDGDGYSLIVDAPAGYVWIENDCTILCEPCENKSQTWHAAACRELEARMMLGVRTVDDAERQAIEDERDEPWDAGADAPETLTPTIR